MDDRSLAFLESFFSEVCENNGNFKKVCFIKYFYINKFKKGTFIKFTLT